MTTMGHTNRSLDILGNARTHNTCYIDSPCPFTGCIGTMQYVTWWCLPIRSHRVTSVGVLNACVIDSLTSTSLPQGVLCRNVCCEGS